MTKLKRYEANQILCELFKRQDEQDDRRIGQNLYNLLPTKVTGCIHNTPNDFYYWEDNSEVLEIFFRECVEG
jgi:hypothetical protein